MAWVNKDGYVIAAKLEHVAIAELALGRALPRGAVVHHVDHNRANNISMNLVICPSQSYHRLIHMREAALVACGHADWRMCKRCKKWDAIANLKYEKGECHYHAACAAKHQLFIYHKNKILKGAPTVRPHPPFAISNDLAEQAIKLYGIGLSIRGVGATLNKSFGAVRRALIRNGIRLRR
jgi:hypothetical protein